MSEAAITVNGRTLSEDQSRVVRVAVTAFLMQLRDKKFAQDLGQLGIVYDTKLNEVMSFINE